MTSFRSAARLLLGLAAVMALASPARAAEALVRTQDGALILPSGEPLHLFRLSPSPQAPWPAQADVAADLAWRAKPEPLFVESLDTTRREILARTTLRGRDLLRSSGMMVQGPDAPADRRDCVDLFVAFLVGVTGPPSEPVQPRTGAFCPWGEVVDPDRHLVVEGLDRRGRRLYAVLADDPRWAIHETADDHGKISLLKMGREPPGSTPRGSTPPGSTPPGSTYVRFQAPDAGPRLRRLRIWQFGRDGQGAPIAEVVLPKAAKTR